MSIKYRPDIDGLRTIAVLSVIFYHAQFTFKGIQLFQGGFIGVDVFFVISGYLIGAILLKEITAGSFSYANFYERRARRILPALFTVMGVTLPFAWFLMLPTAFKEYAGSGLSSLGFSSNIWFWLEDSYSAEASALKPFLHTWSLSVEEQFYLFFPPLVWFGLKQKRIKLGTLLITTIIASLLAAQIYSKLYPNAAFFLLPFRIWELLAGVWLAYAANSKHQIKSHFFTSNASLIGMLLLFISIIFFSDTMQHPSIITMLPIIGTCLIIGTRYHENIAGRLLSSRLMVFIGLLSYSFYLWHVPVFVFSKLAEWPQGNLPKIGYIILSAFLAFLSWHFVEKPYRKRGVLSLRIVSILLTASLIGLIAAFTYIYVSNGAPKRLGLAPAIINTFKAPTKKDYCKNVSVTDGIKLCGFGNHNSKPSFMILGDSHSTITLGMFDKLAKANNTAGILASQAGCLPFLGVYTRNNEPERSQCSSLVSAAYKYLIDNKIERVFMIARWSYYTTPWKDEFQPVSLLKDRVVVSEDESRKNFETAFKQSISELQKAGIKVIILEQIPQQNFTAERAYTIAGQGFGLKKRVVDNVDSAILYANSVSYSDHKKLQSFVHKTFTDHAKMDNVTVLNFDDIFCDEQCSIGTSLKSYYRDDDHLSSYGIELIEPVISKHFKQ